MAGIDGVDDDHNDNSDSQKKQNIDDSAVAPLQDSSDAGKSVSGVEPDVVDKEGDSPKEEKADADENSASLEERMHRFQNVARQLKEVEEQLEAAAVEEDYEKAAELDETLQKLLAEVEALNLTDEEMIAAMALPSDDDKPTAAESTDEKQEDVLTEAATLNAVDGDDDDVAPNDGENENGQEVTVPPVESVQSGSSMDGSQDDSPPSADKSNDNGTAESAEHAELGDDEAVTESKSLDSQMEERPCKHHVDTNGTSAVPAVQSDDDN